MPLRNMELDTGFSGYTSARPELPTPAPERSSRVGIGALLSGDLDTFNAITDESLETLGAGFRMENDILNTVSLLTRPQYKADPSFDLSGRLKADGLWNDYSQNFVGVESEQEYLAISGRITQENKDRATLAAAGTGGMIAAMAAGLLSPTVLLPFVGGLRGGRALVAGIAVGAAGGAAQELPLQMAQETRTLEESVSSIAMSTVLSGVLGGAVGFMRRPIDEVADLMVQADMVPAPGAQAISKPAPGMTRFYHGGGKNGVLDTSSLEDLWVSPQYEYARDYRSGGTPNAVWYVDVPEERLIELGLKNETNGYLQSAKVPKEFAQQASVFDIPKIASGSGRAAGAGAAARLEEAPRLASAFGMENNVGKISPVVRGLTSELDQMRWMTGQLGDAGMEFDGRSVMAKGGTVENRIETHFGPVDKVFRSIEDAYARYMLGAQAAQKPLAIKRAQLAGMNPNRTKMSRQEFRAAVAEAMDNGDQHAVPEVAEMASLFRKEIYDPEMKAAQEVGLLKAVSTDGTVPGDLSYLNRVYRTEMIQAHRTDFENVLTAHYEGKLSADFSEAWTRLTGQEQRAAERIEDFSRSPEEVEELREQFEEQLRQLNEGRNAELVELEDAISDKRSAARTFDSGTPERTRANEEARALEQAGGEALAQTRTERANIRRRLNNLRRAHSALTARQEAKLDKIARAEELSFNTLTRLVRKGQRVLKDFDKVSDAKLDGEVSKLRTQFTEAGARFDRNEERIADSMEDEWWSAQETVAPQAAQSWTASPELPDNIARQAARAEVMPNLAASVREIATEFDQLELPESLSKLVSGLVDQAGDVNWDKLDDFIDKAETFARNSDNPNVQRATDLMVDLQNDLMNADYQVSQAANRIKSEYPRMLEAQRQFFVEQRYTDPADRVNFLEGWKKDDDLPEWTEDTPEGAEFRTAAGPRLGIATRHMYDQLMQEYRIESVANKTTAKPTEGNLTKLDKMQRQQLGLQMKLDELAERLDMREGFDREAARSAIQEGLDEATKRAQSIVERRAVRSAKLKEQAQALDPTAAAQRIDDMKSEGKLRRTEFLDQWRERGADDIDPVTGVSSFKRFASDMALQTTNKILGTYMRLPGIDILAETRGAELARVLDIPGKTLVNRHGESFLERDVEKLAMIYVRTMAPDIELTRSFGPDFMGKRDEALGEVNENWKKLDDEFNARRKRIQGSMEQGIDPKTGKPRVYTVDQIAKEGLRLAKEYKDHRRDLEAMIQRLRYNRGIPDDPAGFGARAGKIVGNLNVTRLMGGTLWSSIPDVGRPIMKQGLLRTFRDGWVPFIKGLAEGKFTPRQMRIGGAAVDVTLHSRSAQIHDVGDYMVRGSKFEKTLEYVTSKMGLIALFDYWTVVGKQFTGSIVNARAMDAFNIVAGGAKASQVDTDDAVKFLAENGIDDDYARRIWNEVQNDGGEMHGGQWWPNTDNWTDKEAVRAYNAMLVKQARDTIVTPGIERPLMMDANLFTRLLFQFKSFGMSSTTKTFLAGAQSMRQGDMAFIQGGIISLALGTLSYYTAANIAGGAVKERMDKAIRDGEWEIFADEAINRSGLLGFGADIQSFIQATPAANFKVGGVVTPWLTFSGERSTRRGGDNFWETLAGPTIGDLGPRAANVAASVGAAVNEGDWRELAEGDIRRLLPLQNHFALRRLYDQIEAAAK